MNQLTVHKGRTINVPVSLGFDVAADVISSQIRAARTQDSQLIATWTVTFVTDGSDGKLIFSLDNSVTSTIQAQVGYMDIKRLSGGEPLSVIDSPIEVVFKEIVTA